MGGYFDRWSDTLVESLLGQGHEGLFNSLVGDRLLIIEAADFRGNFSEGRMLRVV